MPYKDKEIRKKFFEDYYQSNKLEFKNRWLKNLYGLSIETYNKLLEEQDFCCALCERHISTFKKPLFVDHDHVSNRVRGLLCLGCNAGLGMLGDNIEGLQKAIKYLEK